jgi:hypothetical protein
MDPLHPPLFLVVRHLGLYRAAAGRHSNQHHCAVGVAGALGTMAGVVVERVAV